MSHDRPYSPETSLNHLLYSSAAGEHSAHPTRALWALVVSLLAVAGCHAEPRSALHRAIAEERHDDVRLLLEQGADADHMDEADPWTPLMLAARMGDLDSMRLLLGRGADPNRQDLRNGWTPLLHAIHKNQRGAMALLLDSGAEVNTRLSCGTSALRMAAGYGHTALVHDLLELGAVVGEPDLIEAITGVPDLDRFTLGSCQTETVREMLDDAPRAVVEYTAERPYLRVAGLLGCDEIVRLLEARLEEPPPKQD